MLTKKEFIERLLRMHSGMKRSLNNVGDVAIIHIAPLCRNFAEDAAWREYNKDILGYFDNIMSASDKLKMMLELSMSEEEIRKSIIGTINVVRMLSDGLICLEMADTLRKMVDGECLQK